MSFEMEYWYWIVFGVLLMLSEIALASFFVLWFGVAAIIVGVVMLAFPGMPLAAQILLWTILSSLLALAGSNTSSPCRLIVPRRDSRGR
jgi:membrane protein implicated in regulation of membrane protease activity